MMSLRRRAAIGVALSETRIVALTDAGAASATTRVFDRAWNADDAARRQTLADEFRALRAVAGNATALSVVLLPPLAEVRLLDLPPLSSDELRPVVSHDIARYLPVNPVSHVVQVHPRNSDESGASAARLISIAEEDLVEDVLAAARDAGWHVKSIVAAALTWASAARTSAVVVGHQTDWVSVRTELREDALRLGAHGIISARRFSPPRVVSPDPTTVLAGDLSSAMALAVTHADLPDAHSLWPPRVYAERSARRWTEVRSLLAASALLLAVTLGVEWLSLSRNEANIAAERAALRSEVGVAVGRRDTLVSIERALGTIRNFESGAPSWLALLGSIEAALPEDAFLLSLRGTTDTIALMGEAERAAPVIDALSGASAFRAVRVSAPIEQEVEAGEVIAERFSILMLSSPGPGSP